MMSDKIELQLTCKDDHVRKNCGILAHFLLILSKPSLTDVVPACIQMHARLGRNLQLDARHHRTVVGKCTGPCSSCGASYCGGGMAHCVSTHRSRSRDRGNMHTDGQVSVVLKLASLSFFRFVMAFRVNPYYLACSRYPRRGCQIAVFCFCGRADWKQRKLHTLRLSSLMSCTTKQADALLFTPSFLFSSC